MNDLILLVLFAACAIIGFIMVIRTTRSLRAPRNYGKVLLAWSEPARSDFRDDLPTWLAINLHRFTAIGMGAGVLLMLFTRPVLALGFLAFAELPVVVLGVLAAAAAALMGLLWGFMVAGPLAEVIGGDRHYAVADDGLLTTGHVLPWAVFREYSFDSGSGLVTLWSATLPGTPAYLLRPPSAADVQQLLSLLHDRLPEQASRPGWLLSWRFPMLMLLFCLVFGLAAALICSHPTLNSLLLMPLLLWLFLALGSGMIMRLIYGGTPAAAATAA